MQKAKEYENQKALTGGFLISLLICSNRLILQVSLLSLISPPRRGSRAQGNEQHIINVYLTWLQMLQDLCDSSGDHTSWQVLLSSTDTPPVRLSPRPFIIALWWKTKPTSTTYIMYST